MTRRLALAIASTVLILFVCWLPRTYTPDEGDAGGLFGIPHVDKVIHFGVFAVSAALWMWALPESSRVRRVVLGGLALAIVSELGQTVPGIGRDAGLDDALADLAGVCAAAVLVTALERPPGRRARRAVPEPGTADGPA